jgi:FtsZ-binding cell division protein ZapB|tara:strand:+ start:1879 stop:2025 length:147 start_codon:yes stop_codon:yes gene_type:complete
MENINFYAELKGESLELQHTVQILKNCINTLKKENENLKTQLIICHGK